MICYKQLIRPIIFYGFPSWSDISSHQMERLRRIERVCLRTCTNSRRKRNDFIYINNSELLRRADIKRIDKELVTQTVNFFDKPCEDCPLFQASLAHEPTHLDDQRTFYKPPWNLSYLNITNRLYSNNLLLLYHRPSNPANPNTVYNTNQWPRSWDDPQEEDNHPREDSTQHCLFRRMWILRHFVGHQQHILFKWLNAGMNVSQINVWMWKCKCV